MHRHHDPGPAVPRRRSVATTLVLTAALAGACGEDPPPIEAQIATGEPVAVRLTEVASADVPSAGVAGPGGTLWIAERIGSVGCSTATSWASRSWTSPARPPPTANAAC